MKKLWFFFLLFTYQALFRLITLPFRSYTNLVLELQLIGIDLVGGFLLYKILEWLLKREKRKEINNPDSWMHKSYSYWFGEEEP